MRNEFLYRCCRKIGGQSLYIQAVAACARRRKARPLPTPTEAEALLQRLHPDPDRSALLSVPNRLQPDSDLHIIVPVYNMEAYLAECVDSILQQETHYTFRLTLVDDGSTDGSFRLMQSYAADPRVEIIHQENRGLSGARNAALRTIRGAYVLFVDADDRLCPGAVETLMDRATHLQADIVAGGFLLFDANGRREEQLLKEEDDARTVPGYSCGKVIRARLLERIAFPEGYWFEDTIVSMLLLPLAQRVATTARCTYAYRQNPAGITAASRTRLKTIDSVWITRRVLRDRQQLNLPFTPAAYEELLQEVALDHLRLRDLHRPEITEAAFVVSRQTLLPYLPAHPAAKVCTPVQALEQALVEGDYALFRRAAVWIYL
jgi:hypothetical protein